MHGKGQARLRPGPESFEVEELLAYEPCGEGEHLYVRVEKRGLTTDRVAESLARCCGTPRVAVGFAGRKDRHAVARQWMSVRGGHAESLAALEDLTEGRARVLEATRHRNKLRLGHLRGNRFRLILESEEPRIARERIAARLCELVRDGIPNRFGPQRFGQGEGTLHVARALARDEPWEAVRWQLDPTGKWEPGRPPPPGSARGFEGRMRAALRRRPEDPRGALRAAGRDFHKLAASAAQSAIFNAVLDARRELGLLHVLRAGDVARKTGAGAFVCAPADIDDVNRRARPGRLEVVATGPLPGTNPLVPSHEILEQEKAWASATGVAWEWFARGGLLESPGERRSLVVEFLERPRTEVAGGRALELDLALPRGCYATELLAEIAVELPESRAGVGGVESAREIAETPYA